MPYTALQLWHVENLAHRCRHQCYCSTRRVPPKKVSQTRHVAIWPFGGNSNVAVRGDSLVSIVPLRIKHRFFVFACLLVVRHPNTPDTWGAPSPPHSLTVLTQSATWMQLTWQPPEYSHPHERISYRWASYTRRNWKFKLSSIDSEILWSSAHNLYMSEKNLESIKSPEISIKMLDTYM